MKGSAHNMFPDELIASMKERGTARLKAVTSKDERDWPVYKKLRNNAKTKEKRDHFKFKMQMIAKRCGRNSRKWFQIGVKNRLK